MDGIKFGPEDVGKWAFDAGIGKWVKIISFKEYSPYPVGTANDVFLINGLCEFGDKFPGLIPADHPAVKVGRWEVAIPIPPPPKKKVVLEPGRYYVRPGGSLTKTERPIGERVEHFGRSSEVFEITKPITLVEGEE